MPPDILYSITIDCKENWIEIKTVVEKLKEKESPK
ncbi:MAG: hypothetical protein ACJAY8_000176 [Sphingobacteriales bacterium]|jgi:hypothetical protein